MATRTPTTSNQASRNGAVKWAQWTGLLNGDTGAPVSAAEWSGKTFHAFGTFGAGGTVIIEGSNDIDAPTNWAPVSNWQGTNLSATGAALLTARDMPMWVRPRVSAGDGTTSLTVTMVAHKQDNNEYN